MKITKRADQCPLVAHSVDSGMFAIGVEADTKQLLNKSILGVHALDMADRVTIKNGSRFSIELLTRNIESYNNDAQCYLGVAP